MLVICEDCAKKYNIDASRIKGAKAKFSCHACGYIIVVEKPKNDIKSPFKERGGTPAAHPDDKTATHGNTTREAGPETAKKNGKMAASAHSVVTRGRGFPISFYLVVTMLLGFFLITGAFTYLYLTFIPDALNRQVQLRGRALVNSLKETIINPLQRKDYLLVNQEVNRISRLPGVAYAAVINKERKVIAGFFSNLSKYEDQFSQKIKEKGFSADILAQNILANGKQESGVEISIGGIPVHDQATHMTETGAELHIGIYLEGIKRDMQRIFFSPQTLILFFLLSGTGYIFFLLSKRFIIDHMRTLTNIANRISLGELDLVIMTGGPREMRDLGTAVERMRHSVKMAMERITQ